MYKLVARKIEISRLQKFAKGRKAAYVHVRGRRRVGKSEILKHFCRQNVHALYFFGAMDESDKNCLERFILAFESISNTKNLSTLAPTYKTWDRVFKEVGDFASKIHSGFVLVLDEIQWIAKKNNGFLGLLKHHWSEWKKSTSIKLILCGSSNKFFIHNTDAEFNTLRGLKTHADIVVKPFTLSQVKFEFFSTKKWTDEQISLLYMIMGGIPYYLEQVGDDNNFYRAVNRAMFTSESIFLDEIFAILNLEFNQKGINNVINILKAITIYGNTMPGVCRITGLAKQTVSDVVNKLVDYEILFPKFYFDHATPKDNKNTTYCMRDFYLNFYFSKLISLKQKIKNNIDKMLFTTELINAKKSHYIEGFSGQAFELLVESIFLSSAERKEKVFKKLSIGPEQEIQVGHYRTQKTQIDLVVESKEDRESRILEMKWVADTSDIKKFEKQLSRKNYLLAPSYSFDRHLVIGNNKRIKDTSASIIYLSDLI